MCRCEYWDGSDLRASVAEVGGEGGKGEGDYGVCDECQGWAVE